MPLAWFTADDPDAYHICKKCYYEIKDLNLVFVSKRDARHHARLPLCEMRCTEHRDRVRGHGRQCDVFLSSQLR